MDILRQLFVISWLLPSLIGALPTVNQTNGPFFMSVHDGIGIVRTIYPDAVHSSLNGLTLDKKPSSNPQDFQNLKLVLHTPELSSKSQAIWLKSLGSWIEWGRPELKHDQTPGAPIYWDAVMLELIQADALAKQAGYSLPYQGISVVNSSLPRVGQQQQVSYNFYVREPTEYYMVTVGDLDRKAHKIHQFPQEDAAVIS